MTWQPIETAPVSSLDGDPIEILLWIADGGAAGAGGISFGRCYRSASGAVKAVPVSYRGNYTVTHWMPLPEPPETK